MATLVPLFPGIPGGIEVFVVLLIIVLLFGANKLPKLARSSGQAMGEFKKGREEVEQELAEMQGKGAENAENVESAETQSSTIDSDSTSSATEETVETEKQN
ncbi:twin-arginine translocase TatA/TatE family subunit [Halomarina rubra]|uniref:Sec-independent protein translocase protein TatA n=1 Tax=Halomarina rubra TaxID=2071873 RepID=A0ABD6AZE0_9EURY|nr:twin-arginine translocase TatA/TatE family subunit [Halomarina rubra]